MDNNIRMFKNMYMKRLKAYKQIGYELASSLQTDKKVVIAIYEGIIMVKLTIKIYSKPMRKIRYTKAKILPLQWRI